MRAVLCGYYGMGNGGDEALLASLLQMLPPGVEPVVLSGNPAETRGRYGVRAVPRKSAFAVLRALRSAEAFVWGGGSLMQDATSWQNPLYYGGLMGLAQRLGLRTIAWGQGIGPLRRSLARTLARNAFTGCTAVSVRDAPSARWLAEWGLDRFVVAPDPVWALEATPVPGLADLPAPRVAVALRAHPSLTPERLSLLARALADLQKATDSCILLVPFQPAVDLPVSQAIARALPGPHKVLQLRDPKQLKGVFQGAEMAIAMRFHGAIAAAAEGCRCFALSYDPKVSALMDELELPGWDLTAPDGDRALPEDAIAIGRAWLECYANGEPLSGDRRQSLRDRARLHQSLLADALA